MSRRREAKKRKINPDPVFGDLTVSRFINTIMKSGKKSIAESIVYGAFDELQEKSGNKENKNEVIIGLLKKSLDNVGPLVEVKARRVGGSVYQIPVPVNTFRRLTLAMRWIIDAATKRSEKTMALRLAAELNDASLGRGAAIKKREAVHSMAEANKAFSHFR